MSVLVIDRELERLEALWADGLSDAYRSYLGAVEAFDADVQPRLALAAALIEVGLRLQGLGGPAAPPAALLMGDLCLARASRLLADAASQRVQVAFAGAIEEMASSAASGTLGPPVRELLLNAFGPPR